MDRIPRIPDSSVDLIQMYGGPAAGRWARMAQSADASNETSAKVRVMALRRAFKASLDYDAPEIVRESTPLVFRMGRDMRRDPAEQVLILVHLLTKDLDSLYPGLEFWSRANSPRISDVDIYRCKYRNKKRRLHRRERQRWNKAERISRSVAAERGASMVRHPNDYTLQQMDDLEAVRAGERVY